MFPSGLTVGAYLDGLDPKPSYFIPGSLTDPTAMLYILEVLQLISYIKHYWRRDRMLIKAVVIICFLADTLCTVSILVWVMMVGRMSLIHFHYSMHLQVDVVHWGKYWQTIL